MNQRRLQNTDGEMDRRLFSLLLEHVPASVAAFDSQMRYMAVSRRWLLDYGIKDPDIIGRSHYDVFPEIPQRWKDIHTRCLAGNAEKCEGEPFVRASGETTWIRWEIHPWYTGEGRVGGLLIMSEELTARRIIDIELQEKTRQLAQMDQILNELVQNEIENLRRHEQAMLIQSRHMAMGELVGNIAHHWRQPLNAVSLMVQELILAFQAREMDADLLEKTGRRIQWTLKEMSGIIDVFAGQVRPHTDASTFMASKEINRAVMLTQPSFQSSGVQIRCDLENDFQMAGYEGELSHVITTLLNYTREVLVASRVADPCICITVKQSENRLIEISDNCGENFEAMNAQLFEPYAGGSDSHGGIALFTARSIVENILGGELTVRKTSTGVCFSVSLPLQPNVFLGPNGGQVGVR